MNKGGVGLGSGGGGGPTAAAAAQAAQKQKSLQLRVDSDIGDIVDNFSFVVNVARVFSLALSSTAFCVLCQLFLFRAVFSSVKYQLSL